MGEVGKADQPCNRQCAAHEERLIGIVEFPMLGRRPPIVGVEAEPDFGDGFGDEGRDHRRQIEGADGDHIVDEELLAGGAHRDEGIELW